MLRRKRTRHLLSPCRLFAFLTTVTAIGSGHASPGFVTERKALLNRVPAVAGPSYRSARGGSIEDLTTVQETNTTTLLSTNYSSESLSSNFSSSTTSKGKSAQIQNQEPGPWPCMDELDKKLIKISLPVIANFAISPMVGAIDLVFINRLGNALAVAGQSAANQVFGSVFWLTSFLPSLTAIEVSRESAQGNQQGVQEAVCRALFVGIVFACLGSVFLMTFTDTALNSVLKNGSPALEFARPYLKIRGLSFLPSLISIVGFSAFRGQLDTTTPVRISFFSNVFHALLVPLFVFSLSMGVSGAALATLIAETISAVTYMVLMTQKNLIQMDKVFKIPDMAKVMELIKGGFALQLRNIAFNLTFITVTRMTQSIDTTGVAPAAHAMALQTFQVGGIVLLALSVVAQTVVPGALVETYDETQQRVVGGVDHARALVKRLMSWGLILGAALGALQIVLLPFILKSTPLQEVRDAARLPAYMSSVLQIINGAVFIGEGVMVGTGSFLFLSLSTAFASVGCIAALRLLTPRFGLAGIWLGLAVFNSIRLVSVWLHQHIIGPFAKEKNAQPTLALTDNEANEGIQAEHNMVDSPAAKVKSEPS